MASKRDNGTGSIYQRENGSWLGKIYLGKKVDGKPRVKYISGKTQAEVKRKIREFNQSANKDAVAKITIGEYLENWRKLYKKSTIKQSSYDTIERTFKNYIDPRIGMLQLQQLTSDDIQKLLQDLKNDGYSYSTIKKVYDQLNEALKFALAKDDIYKNPMSTVKMLKKDAFEFKEIRYFNNAECKLISEEAHKKYSTGSDVYIYGDAFILTLNTGLRLGELIGLEKSDWDKDANILHVRRNMQPVMKRDVNGDAIPGRTLVAGTTKTYSGYRPIPLNKNATEAITRLCEKHPDSKYIVCSSKGDMVPHERVERTFSRLLKNCGIEKAGVHALRHTFASMLFANNKNVKIISKLLGHASVQITMNVYVHLLEDINHDDVAVLDDVF